MLSTAASSTGPCASALNRRLRYRRAPRRPGSIPARGRGQEEHRLKRARAVAGVPRRREQPLGGRIQVGDLGERDRELEPAQKDERPPVAETRDLRREHLKFAMDALGVRVRTALYAHELVDRPRTHLGGAIAGDATLL